ncbi:MAG TPA: gamma-glutamyltransferase family protein, partial [Hyphomicrobiaceae bacterium]|nr:gamma-glutamyltransferase family protein [Hyphomicrobiaceae bacterium]
MTNKNPMVTAHEFAISSGHELASQAGYDILKAGGNAIDAGVAAGIALGVLHCDLVNVAGVAPIILRMAATGKVVTIDGLGTWPRTASAEFFEKEHGGQIPEGILRTVVPAAPAAWITALKDFGTMSFGEVADGALRCARDGFPVYKVFAEFIADNEEKYRRYAENERIFLPNGRAPKVGEVFVQTDLAASLQYMVDQEQAAGGDRLAGLGAAYDAFYRGDIAQAICAFHKSHGGFLTLEDMAEYKVRYEEPLKVRFAGCDFYTCGAWCQGVSFAQLLGLMEQAGLDQFAPTSPDYIHHLSEIMKLVFADREAYVTDPAFADVPVAALLDPAYLATRLGQVDPARAYPEMPPAGGLFANSDADIASAPMPSTDDGLVAGGPASADTSHVCVIDGAGNMFAATPSDTSIDTEVIPGTGLCPSSRGSQSRGLRNHINAVAPGKRPRLTPNPAIAIKDGKPFMAFGTPGGDVQIQAMAQVAANVLHFGMDIQTAIEAPRFSTYSFPSSFAPHAYYPGLLMMEKRIGDTTAQALADRGHKVDWWVDW